MITLATLPSKSKQEIFDHIALHLLTQNKTSFLKESDDSACAYRSYNGLKCAAGCLMSDLEYSKEFEGITWLELSSMGKVPKEHARLISDLQKIHDTVLPENWPRSILMTAVEHGLSYLKIGDFINNRGN